MPGQLRNRAREALSIYMLSFGAGALNHARDFLAFGVRPYGMAPLPVELFWTSLVVLDRAVVALLVMRRRRAGLALAVTVMIVDVASRAMPVIRRGRSRAGRVRRRE